MHWGNADDCWGINMLTLGMITIVVDDYDAAISHYVNELGFTLIEDAVLTPEKRWVVIAPGTEGAKILLAKAATDEQRSAIGNSTGGRVGFFMYTTEFVETYEKYKTRGIEFVEKPRQEAYGWVVVFKDKYGNKWDLIESKIN
jgi:catechol 2,3-dioxygenase-like lactoylglutathione lyase family enzyme